MVWLGDWSEKDNRKQSIHRFVDRVRNRHEKKSARRTDRAHYFNISLLVYIELNCKRAAKICFIFAANELKSRIVKIWTYFNECSEWWWWWRRIRLFLFRRSFSYINCRRSLFQLEYQHCSFITIYNAIESLRCVPFSLKRCAINSHR